MWLHLVQGPKGGLLLGHGLLQELIHLMVSELPRRGDC